MLQSLGVISLIALFVLFLLFGPIFTIWALNLLFGTGIPVTFWTWLSTVWLQGFLVARAVK